MSTNVIGALEPLFDANVRRRGDDYVDQRRVRLREGGPEFVEAEVRGSALYQVSLDVSDADILEVRCDCPHFEGGSVCKHVWATVKAAVLNGWLTAIDPSLPLHLEAAADFTGMDFGEPDGALDDPFSGGFHADAGGMTPWQQFLEPLRTRCVDASHEPDEERLARGELLYVIGVHPAPPGQELMIRLQHRFRKKSGEWSKLKPINATPSLLSRLGSDADRRIWTLLLGGGSPWRYGGYSAASEFLVNHHLAEILFPVIAETGRLYVGTQAEHLVGPLRYDRDCVYHLGLRVRKDEAAKQYRVDGFLEGGGERRALSEPMLLTSGGHVFWPDRITPLADGGIFPWIAQLRRVREVSVPLKSGVEFVSRLLLCPVVPPLELPDELRFEEIRLEPSPRLVVRQSRDPLQVDMLWCRVEFVYGATVVAAGADAPIAALEMQPLRLVVRDAKAEAALLEQAAEAGLREAPYRGPARAKFPHNLPSARLPGAVRTLLPLGWRVEAEGKLCRLGGPVRLNVSTGLDWFELKGQIDFGGVSAQLPALLQALSRGENTVRLDDGSLGVLPEEWLQKCGALAALGTPEEDHLRFSRAQAGLLDALLAAEPEATCDELFQHARRELAAFDHIDPVTPEAGFTGVLRPYQQEGLGWLLFLQRFGFGGCLADDMGLGKTVQVLALIESRRAARERLPPGDPGRPAPSLVVVPRSLVFNWRREAERFSPKLRVLDHLGADRVKGTAHLEDYDVVLTTYGTLRRDATILRDTTFDYLILDEAQAIKNAAADCSKAARLLKARHRLAMSGTPVENHLGELWSLFEFLNPGMLGRASVFRNCLADDAGPEGRALLARALRMFILRRTKVQVAKDLPAKTEETVYCELDATQRKLYDELRDYYRDALLAKVNTVGIGRAKIMVLEALLRLRQAACHPGLIDAKRASAPSAKLDTLLPQLREVVEEGHKVLVFSQFTSFLAIVRSRLDEEGIAYEYLDGRTRDREACVQRFQNEAGCRLFLISLKAGGLGLNLTAAEYVFLLDPWWNPAVEAQAIDRTHRIGQTRRVFAYRLIARDTVEERVLELQKTKRLLAEAIITEDNSLIRNLTAEDLKILLA